MATLSFKQIDQLFKNIKQFQSENKQISNAFNVIVGRDAVYSCGGKLLDSLIDLLEIELKDKHKIIEWYIFENKCGEKNLVKNIGGKKIKINSSY